MFLKPEERGFSFCFFVRGQRKIFNSVQIKVSFPCRSCLLLATQKLSSIIKSSQQLELGTPVPPPPSNYKMAITQFNKNSKVSYKFSTDNLASVAWSFYNDKITHFFLLAHTRNGKFFSIYLALLSKYYLSATLQMTTFLCLFFFPLEYMGTMYFRHPSPSLLQVPLCLHYQALLNSYQYCPYLHVCRTCP